MEMIAPQGPVYQAGTFSGNPLSLAAGTATVRWLHAHRGIYDDLARAGRTIGETLDGKGNGSFVQLGSMFKYFFRSHPPRDYKEAMECDTARFAVFWQAMLSGIFLPPSRSRPLPLGCAEEQMSGPSARRTRMPLKIGTRGSTLALAQAEKVARQLRESGHEVELSIISTLGDEVSGVPLHEIGGNGVFVRALDDAILAGSIDAAVHSMKDIPAWRPAGLCTCAILERDSPADFLVHSVPANEIRVIGTSSTRRMAQLKRYRKGSEIRPVRGNVDTRLRKLSEGQFDAIVLAEAGLVRMSLNVPG
jgi:hypothetical protein